MEVTVPLLAEFKALIPVVFDDIVDMINTPIRVFGKEVDDLYIQDYISKNYPEIDFSRIKINAASKDESRRRNKEYNKSHVKGL